MGRGKRGEKVFLESVTSVGHSSSGGKPITLKWHNFQLNRYNMNHLPVYLLESGKLWNYFLTHSKIFPSWSPSDSPQNKGLTDRKLKQTVNKLKPMLSLKFLLGQEGNRNMISFRQRLAVWHEGREEWFATSHPNQLVMAHDTMSYNIITL